MAKYIKGDILKRIDMNMFYEILEVNLGTYRICPMSNNDAINVESLESISIIDIATHLILYKRNLTNLFNQL